MKSEGGNRLRGQIKVSTSDKPLVSVITVVRNRAKTVEQAITSVLHQTYDNIEYIVVDGVSTDGTLDIIKKYDNRIDYWVSEKDTGIYNAMNKGIGLSNGEIVGIINSDDAYYPWAIEEIVKANKTANADIFHGNLLFFTEFKNYCHFNHAKPDIKQMFIRPSIFHPTCFVKKSVYNSIGLFDESFKLIADYDFLLRALENNYQFFYIDRSIAVFRNGGLSQSGKGWHESFLLLKKHPQHKCPKWKIYKNIVSISFKYYIKALIKYDRIIEGNLIKK